MRNGELAESFAALSGSRGRLGASAAARMLLGGGRPPLPAPYRRSWLDGLHPAPPRRRGPRRRGAPADAARGDGPPPSGNVAAAGGGGRVIADGESS